MSSRPRTLSLLSAALVLASCYNGTDESLEPPISPSPQPGSPDAEEAIMPRGTSLFIEVVDPDGAPIGRARVTLSLPVTPPEGATPVRAPSDRRVTRPQGARSADRVEFRTDPAGRVLLEELERYVGDRVVATVEARGYAPASVVLEGVTPDAHMGARVVLLPVAASTAFDSRSGVLLVHEGLRVEIPADGLVDADGAPFDGIAELSVVPFDSTNQALQHPGPLTATREDGSATFLRSLGMAEVHLTHEGEPLQLRPGAQARLELPLPAALQADPDASRRPQVGQEIAAWWFDHVEGKWKEEGAGTVIEATDRPGELAWVTDVAHFTWWNVDEPWWNHSCLLVTVFMDGMPVQGVTVQVKGLWGQSQPQVTDANGEVCTAMAIGEVGTVYIGGDNMWLVPPFEVMGKPEAAACDGNGNACQAVPVDLNPNDLECELGQYYECAYTGPNGTDGVGECHGGKIWCGPDHKWEADCTGQQLPEPEDPQTDADENCNGDGHDGMIECPEEGLVVACYDGPGGTMDVGDCQQGTKKCILDNGSLIWGPCIGEITPDAEQCATAADESCDGNPGCGLTTWTRNGGDEQVQSIHAVAIGSNDDIFVLGRGAGTMKWQGQDVPSVDLGDTEQTFLARIMPDGQLDSIVALGPDVRGELELAVRGDDQVFVAATLAGANGGPGLFMGLDACPQALGLDADGLVFAFTGTTCAQMRVLGGSSGPAIPSAVAVAGDRVYVAGAFGGTLGSLQTADNTDDAFVLGLAAADLAGPVQLGMQFASDWASYELNRPALAATVDDFAVVFAYGGQVKLGGKDYFAGIGGSTMLARIGHDGQVLWATSIGDGAVGGYAVALDSQGAATVAADFGAGLQVAQWREPLGANWSETMADAAMIQPELGGARLAVASDDRVVLQASKAGAAYMRKWTRGGVTDWEHSAGGPGTSDGFGVAVSPIDRATVVVGRMNGDITFPDNFMMPNVEPGDTVDGYVVKLQP